MKKTLLPLATAVLALCASTANAADGAGVYVPFGVGFQAFDNSQTHIQDDIFPTFGVGYQFNPDVAVEVMYTRGHADRGHTSANRSMNVEYQNFRIDALRYFSPLFSDVRPYVMGGIGDNRFDPSNLSVTEDNTLNLGVGLMKPLGDHWAVRADITNSYSLDDEEDEWGARLLVQYNFFSPLKPVPPAPAPQPVADEPVDINLVVNFDVDKAVVKPNYSSALKGVGDYMAQHEDVRVKLSGHTDSTASEAYNQKLSERRANAVKEALVKGHGVPADHVATEGYGESSPVASNATREGRQANRRTNAEFTKQK